jgi:hypothetical protein
MQEAAQIEKVLFTRFFGGKNSQGPVFSMYMPATQEQNHRKFHGKSGFLVNFTSLDGRGLRF